MAEAYYYQCIDHTGSVFSQTGYMQGSSLFPAVGSRLESSLVLEAQLKIGYINIALLGVDGMPPSLRTAYLGNEPPMASDKSGFLCQCSGNTTAYLVLDIILGVSRIFTCILHMTVVL